MYESSKEDGSCIKDGHHLCVLSSTLYRRVVDSHSNVQHCKSSYPEAK